MYPKFLSQNKIIFNKTLGTSVITVVQGPNPPWITKRGMIKILYDNTCGNLDSCHEYPDPPEVPGPVQITGQFCWDFVLNNNQQ